MALVIKTKSAAGYDVEVAGVGVCAAGGKGGILVEDAADVLVELQRDGEPLSGKALEDAARAFAKSRDLTVTTEKGTDVEKLREKLRVDAGAFPAGKSIEEISREAAERDLGQVEARSDEALTDPSNLPPQGTTGPDPETAR